MTGGPGGGEPALAHLREQARQLVSELTGPLRRLTMRSGDAVLEIEWHGERIVVGTPVAPSPPAGPAPLAAPHPAEAAEAADADAEKRITIVSPIVGTFYRAPEPGAPPFVEVGDVVEPGQVIGIVEAMKLMNHITADQPGKVAEVLVGNGEPVEFEQPLVALVPA